MDKATPRIILQLHVRIERFTVNYTYEIYTNMCDTQLCTNQYEPLQPRPREYVGIWYHLICKLANFANKRVDMLLMPIYLGIAVIGASCCDCPASCLVLFVNVVLL